jgi:hypothetical protein
MCSHVMGVAIVAVLLGAMGPAAWAQPATPSRADQGVAARQATNPDANALATALAEFQKRLQDYIKLRAEMGRKLTPLSSTADSAELAARQDLLAAALREARKGAKPGDVIPTRVAGQIRTVITADFRRRTAAANRALFEEVNRIRPVINRTMPDSVPLVTVPPLLLSNLPPLPDNLQYRFLDPHVVLMDGDTRIIIDYILNVLPPH